MPTIKSNRPQYLHEWLNTTGMTQAQFLRMFFNHTGVEMPQSQLSNLLRGSKPCSVSRAIAISEITGVPVENLVEWPRVRSRRTFEHQVENQVQE